jgi:C-terminal processing protease CtpA/Prc
MKRKTLSLLFLAICSAVCIAGCADRWNGSVDAVFRYRPSETSTVIQEIRPGSLAEEAGLKAGDVLLAIDGTDIDKADFETVRDALRGPVGTNAVIKIKRGQEILEFTVERRPIAKNKD